MAIIELSKFGVIETLVPAGTGLEDIQLEISTRYILPQIEISSPDTIIKLEGRALTIALDRLWPEGIDIAVRVGSSDLADRYVVPPNLSIYDPEQALYSEGILADASLDDLESRGVITLEEKSILERMGPKLTASMDVVHGCLLRTFSYKGVTSSDAVKRSLCLRELQRRAYLLNLSSLVEAVLLSPGPLKDAVLYSHIPSSRIDSQVISRLQGVKDTLAKVRNAMTSANLNTDVIDSLEYEIDTSTGHYFLEQCIVTLFCALRYTHDNPKFSY